MPLTRILRVLVCIGLSAVSASDAVGAKLSGSRKVWAPITLDIHGPHAEEQGAVNPFLDYRVTVEFSSGGVVHQVPAYFAADGNAAHTSARGGNVWRAHFVPEKTGQWSYRVSARGGSQIAVRPEEQGEAVLGDGESGSFEVVANPGARGRLQYVGERYLRFAGTGEWFLKSGADSPENFLAYTDFDGTYKEGSEPTRRGEATGTGLHRYAPHLGDWKPGDPTWSGQRGKSILGAVNYLASRGINSIYFLTMNVRGDGNDVWPWTSAKERFRFDCSKLDQWDIVFSHMESLGIALHVVLTETENESLLEYEEKNQFALRRKLYFRELAARFAYHNGLVWNLGEENGWDDRGSKDAEDEDWRIGNTPSQRKAFAAYLREVDPYDHPIVVHTLPGRYEEIYRSLLGDPGFDGVSLQVQLGPRIHEETKKWIRESVEAGRPWFANLDEIGPAKEGVKPDADDPRHDEVRRFALWGNLMAGGGGCEWYFGYEYAHNDLNLEDYRSREEMWRQTALAVEFFQEHLPYWEMKPATDLTSNEGAYCLAKHKHTYALYLPEGGDASLILPPGSYEVHWFDAYQGGELQMGTKRAVQGGGHVSLGSSPTVGGDWVAVVRSLGD